MKKLLKLKNGILRNFLTPLSILIIATGYMTNTLLSADESPNANDASQSTEVSIAFIPFEDKTGTDNYLYLAESISEAVNGKMSKKFKFKSIDPAKIKEAFPDSEITKRADLETVKSYAETLNAEIIVFGDYIYNNTSNQIEMTAQIYIPFIKSNKQLKKISNAVDHTLFNAADKVADQVIMTINTMISASKTASREKKVITTEEIIKVNTELMTTGRFSDNKNGTVRDNLKSLLWQKCSAGLSGENCENGEIEWINWQSAMTYCQNFNKKSKWRLPSLDELQSITKKDSTPSINKEIFPQTMTKNYWTSTNYGSQITSSWYVSFYEGIAGAGSIKSLGYLRCVSDM